VDGTPIGSEGFLANSGGDLAIAGLENDHFVFARSVLGAGGRILDGWAMACQGEADEGIEKLDEGLAAWRKTGARLWLPIFLALKAEARAKVGRSDTALNIIEEALAISDETGERWALAEVLRIKASLLQAAGRAAADEIEKLLVESLEMGRHQQALSWQLRTACDLSRLWQEQGRNDEALTLLQSIYNKFTEGSARPT
jgi:predicted ATPase